MSRGTIQVDDRGLARYLDAANRPETPTQLKLRADTGKMSNAGMQIGANQGSFMAFMVRADRRKETAWRSAPFTER